MTNYSTYTSVARDGNNILFMGYDTEGNPVKEKIRFKPEIFLEKKDGPFKSLSGVECQRKEFDSIGETYDYLKTYKDIYKIYGCSDYVRQFIGRSFRGELKSRNDLVQVWWFDIETKIGGSITEEVIEDDSLEADSESEEVVSKGGFPNPETAEEEITLITMYNRTQNKITTWGLYAIDDPKVNTKHSAQQVQEDVEWIRSKNVDYRMFSEESSMLKDFLLFVKTNRIDVLSGWNSEFFDIPYLYNRLVKLLGESLAKHLSPWKIVETHKKFVMNKERTTYEIAGLNHLDLLDLYKKFNPGSKESFNLGFISNYELGTTKVELPGEDFKDSYENYWSTFVRYNIVDVLLLEEIDQKKQIIDLAMGMAYMAKCNYGDVVSAMRVWESLIYNFLSDSNIVEDWEKPHSKKDSLEGAYVHVPIPGKYRFFTSIDAQAEYPSIMMQNNLSPETVIGKFEEEKYIKWCESRNKTKYGDIQPMAADHLGLVVSDFVSGKFVSLQSYLDDLDAIVSSNGLLTTRSKNGFIATLTKMVFDGRVNAKTKMLTLKKDLHLVEDLLKKQEMINEIASLNTKQGAYKTLGASLYGVCSLPHFRYYNHLIAEAVTSTGQDMLKTTMQIVENTLHKMDLTTRDFHFVKYSDTDSVFFTMEHFVNKFCKNKTKKDAIAFIEKFVKQVLQPEINDRLKQITSSMGAPENKMFFKLEGISENAIFLAKKRYIAALDYNEGVWYDPPEMKIMGMEIVRSSTPKFIKEQLKKAVEICINGTEADLQKFVAKEKEVFMQKDIEDISFPRGCNGLSVYTDPDRIYKPKTPVAVRGALMHNHLIKEKGLSSKIQQIGDGDRVKFVYLKMPNPTHENVISYVNKLPVEFNVAKYVDKKTQFEKGFIKPLEGVLSAINWNWEEKNLLDL